MVFGPTGVGKTALLERHFTGRAEIVSADSLQVYKGLDIGTAKPDPETLLHIPHHLIDILDFTEVFSVGEFCRRVDVLVENILAREMIPIISGGTAYYLKGWLIGLPQTPPADPEVRARIHEQWKQRSDEELQDELARIDPISAERIAPADRYRKLRALEIYAQSGRPLSDFPVPDKPREDYRVLPIGLQREKADLTRRIERRVDRMLADGLEEEVRKLVASGARPEHPGMKAIGYREWFGTESGTLRPAAEVRDLIIRNTRRYAKRQMTFFRALPGVRWFDASEDPQAPGGVIETIESFLAVGG